MNTNTIKKSKENKNLSENFDKTERKGGGERKSKKSIQIKNLKNYKNLK